MSKLKEIRESQGLSQGVLADLSGVNFQMIQHYEQGVRDLSKAQAGTVLKLAKVLDCTIEELLAD